MCLLPRAPLRCGGRSRYGLIGHRPGIGSRSPRRATVAAAIASPTDDRAGDAQVGLQKGRRPFGRSPRLACQRSSAGRLDFPSSAAKAFRRTESLLRAGRCISARKPAVPRPGWRRDSHPGNRWLAARLPALLTLGERLTHARHSPLRRCPKAATQPGPVSSSVAAKANSGRVKSAAWPIGLAAGPACPISYACRDGWRVSRLPVWRFRAGPAACYGTTLAPGHPASNDPNFSRA